jgi:putative ABC transport system substrate-binding protein
LVNLTTFRQGLAEAGFVEGKNVRFEFHGSAINGDLAALAVELVNKRPAVIVAMGSPPAILAARAATSTAERLSQFKQSLSKAGGEGQK